MNRERSLKDAMGEARPWDVVVVGGGATGLGAALDAAYFGEAWARVQAASPVLRRRRVAFAALARETRLALRLRDEIREGQAVRLLVGACDARR